jgi:MOSC domain-containing protein YiiM
VTAARVTHVCRVDRLHRDPGAVGVTAIDKRQVEGPVPVGDLGVRGDVQADRAHHGGPDKAVYALDADEAAHWAAELGEDVPPGRLGENLRVAMAVDDAVIGERWRIGDTLEVEVTGPRSPCATFGRWLGQDGWVARFAARGRPGVYLRVTTPGAVAAGDPVEVTHRPGHGVSVARWFVGQDPDDARRLLDDAAGGGWGMADYLREYVERAAAR